MQKLIYSNVILIMLFLVLPWTYFQNTELGDRFFSASALIYFMSIASLLLLYINIRSAIKMRGKAKKVAIFLIIPPAFVLLYFILGYFAFSGFTGF